VEGAAANALPDPVPEEVKEARRSRLMEVQARVSRKRLASKVGARMPVLIDQVTPRHALGRGPGDAPEIDGVVRVEGASGLKPGDLVEVTITGSDTHDLRAIPVGRTPQQAARTAAG
jgi:ribosomal protein S12 methylthiotransferase